MAWVWMSGATRRQLEALAHCRTAPLTSVGGGALQIPEHHVEDVEDVVAGAGDEHVDEGDEGPDLGQPLQRLDQPGDRGAPTAAGADGPGQSAAAPRALPAAPPVR